MPSPSIEDVLFAASALPAAERHCFLQRVYTTGPQHELVAELLSSAHDAAAFFGESAAANLNEENERIEAYRLIRELGEGGCGIVYLAEQLAPIKREVALKIIKLGMDTKAVINRFEAERQALAMMDHPNIAKVFDAGATSSGRPYFVMELVRGIKITEYCDQCRLTVDERLELFIQVCQAIQHAHLKGIIHRDIKPSNVLVTLHDGEPVVKVIDFGVAKAIQGRLTDHTLNTLVDQLIGTPAYMSPEQTEPGALGVDTRSDVYSLGVLLYELITGATPFDNEELLNSGFDAMRLRIRNEEPPRPSKRTDKLSGSASHAQRHTRVVRVHGDLDLIVMRCLEKEPSLRYQAVVELVEDIQRFLLARPIAAKNRTLLYATRKFAERHRTAFFVGLAAITILASAAGVSAWQAWRATRAEQLAQEAIRSLVNAYSAADPFSHHDAGDVTRELLERAARTARDDLRSYPAAQAQLLESIGRIYRRRRETTQALPLLESAVQVRRRAVPDNIPALLTAMKELAVAREVAGDFIGAAEVLTEAMQMAERSGMTRSTVYADLLLTRSAVERELGGITRALAYVDQSLTLNRDLLGPKHPVVAVVLATRASLLLWIDDFSAAESSAGAAIEIMKAQFPPLHPQRLTAEANLAAALLYQGRCEESETILEPLLAKRRQVYGEDSVAVAMTLGLLAESSAALGRLEEAERHARHSLSLIERVHGPEHFETAYSRVALALVLEQSGNYQEAEREARHAVRTYSMNANASRQYEAAAEYVLGEILLAIGRASEAEAVLRRSIEHWDTTKAAQWRAARSASALGAALLQQGRLAEAQRLITDSYRIVAMAPGATPYARAKTQAHLAQLSAARGRAAKPLAQNLAQRVSASARSSATVPSESASPAAH